MKKLILLVALAGCGNPSNPMPDGNEPGDMGQVPLPDLAGTVSGMLPKQTGTGSFSITGRQESRIEAWVPDPLPANPPLVIAFHATGGEPTDEGSELQLDVNVPKYGFVAIAPRAGYRNGQYPGDVDHQPDSTGSNWNMNDLNPSTNEDLRYVVAIIAAAQATYNADTTRVYTFGFSNGAFMSYFTAASMPDKIAGFAEASGGWTTDNCPTRYGADSDGISFYPTSGPGPGVQIQCSTLFATTNPQFPTKCIPSASNKLRPPTPGARVPFGYLSHYTSDDIVSVQWSCILAASLGSRAMPSIRRSDSDGTMSHNPQPDYFEKAWTFFAGRTNSQ